MFHTSHIHVPRSGRPSALRTFVTSSSFGSAETKEPLRRGILFTTVASVLLLVGSILTWLGFSDVFGGKVSMTGPLLIALALLLLLLSMRQFLIARKRNNSTRNGLQLGQMGRGTVTAVVVDRNDGVGAVTVVMDSHSIDQETHFRNSASSTVEDYEPPSYSEVTQCVPAATPLCGQPVVCQDEPPPPYEEAVVGDGSSSVPTRNSGQSHSEESAPAYSPQGHTGYSLDRGSNMMTIPGQVPASQCYHCCMFPTSTGLDVNSGGQLTPHSISAGQVLGTQELTSNSSRPWSSPRRFVLIPHFLGIFANGPTDPAHRMTGELPPAYQAVDTTGRSPLTYVQAMALSNPPSLSSDHLGIQSPHESRPPASQTMQDQLVDTYHPPRSKGCISPGVVPITNFPISGSIGLSSSQNSTQPSPSVPGSSNLACDTSPTSSGRRSLHPSSGLLGTCTSSHSSVPGSISPGSSLSSGDSGSCPHSLTVPVAGTHISIYSPTGTSVPGSTASPHINSSIPGASPYTSSNTSSATGSTVSRTSVTYTVPQLVMAQHSSSSPIVDELEEVL